MGFGNPTHSEVDRTINNGFQRVDLLFNGTKKNKYYGGSIAPRKTLVDQKMSRESLESSLPVPSVQDLAIQRLEKVPARYVRDDLEDIATVNTDASLRIPLIDMTKLVNPDSGHTELHKLHSACKNWGVFQLINHGVSVRDIVKTCQEFFELPGQEKKQWAQKPASLEGYGQAFVASEDQTLDWNDMIFLNTLPLEIRNLNFWPTNPPHFRETLGRYSEEARQVASCLIGFMAKALGVQDQQEQLSKAFEEGSYSTRFNCYPPCPEPERVLGIMPHADISGITMLLDGGDMPGLQMLKDGHWYFVEPIDGALVVNIGQIMEVVSNGIYKAPEHRAVVNKWKERLSIVTFCYPSSSVQVGPAKELTESGAQPLYKTLTIEEYWYKFYNRKLDAQFIDLLKI